MGGCISKGNDVDRRLHKEVEKELKVAERERQKDVKVLLLGSGDSGKSTVLKQMRLIHQKPFSPQEIEGFRQRVFNNLTRGMYDLLEAMQDMELALPEHLVPHADLIEHAEELRDDEPFPARYYHPLKELWEDSVVQQAWARGNEAAVPENLPYYFTDLQRLFDPTYHPTEKDIVHTRARTVGITETKFDINTFDKKNSTMTVVDVGGQKTERRKWIHQFQDVSSILFLVNLSGYDQCLVEDKDGNQMQDAMTIWDSICNSQWFKSTSLILFLNKQDLFETKVMHSNISAFYPDFNGPEKDIIAGKEYFRRRFERLAKKAGRTQARQVYIHFTVATDNELLRVVMAAVEDMIVRSFLEDAVLL